MKLENLSCISAKALAGLKRSLEKFGDLSGLVWNKRIGHLVCGHQRLTALAGARMEDGVVVAAKAKYLRMLA